MRDVTGLLDRRHADGFVRRCHGDLHLRNICLIDGRPTLFDAIEFNDAIACVDILYDLAFLLMDLERRGLRGEANLLLNRWLRDEADLAGLAAAPDFRRVRGLLPAVKRMLPSVEMEERSAWLGFRPSPPDSLPAIGPSPAVPDAYLAFGHGHLGFTRGRSPAATPASTSRPIGRGGEPRA